MQASLVTVRLGCTNVPMRYTVYGMMLLKMDWWQSEACRAKWIIKIIDKKCCISLVYLHIETWCTVHTTLNSTSRLWLVFKLKWDNWKRKCTKWKNNWHFRGHRLVLGVTGHCEPPNLLRASQGSSRQKWNHEFPGSLRSSIFPCKNFPKHNFSCTISRST